MAAERTIAIRLTLAEADQVRAALKGVGADGQAAFKQIGDASVQAGAAMASGTASVTAYSRAAADAAAASASLGGKLEAARAQYQATAAAAAAAAVVQGQAIANAATNIGRASSSLNAARESAAAFTAGIDALRARWVPLAAAQQQFVAAQDGIANAFKVGAISASEANTAMKAVQDRYTATAQAASLAAERAREANAAQGQATANAYAGVKTPNVATDQVDYARRAQDLEAAFEAADRLRAEMVPLAAAEQAYAAQVEKIASAEKAGIITGQEAEAARQKATKTYTSQVAALHELENGHKGAAASGKLESYQLIEIGESAHKFADGILSGGGALRAFAYEAPNAIAIAGGFKNAMAALAGVAPYLAIAAVTASIVGLGYAAVEHQGEVLQLGQQLRATRDDYTSYAKTIETTARQVAASTTLSIKEALDTVKAIGGNKYFSGSNDDLKRLAIDAQNLSVVLGVPLVDATKVVTGGLDDTSRAAHELASNGFSGFNVELLQQIDHLQLAGQRAAAFALFLKTVEDRSKGAAVDGATPLATALTNLRKGFDLTAQSSKNAGLSLGDYIAAGATIAIEAITSTLHWVDRLEATLLALPAAVRKAAKDDLFPDSKDASGGSPAGAVPGASVGVSSPTPSAGRDAFVKQYSDDAIRVGNQLGTSAVNVMADWLMETANGTSTRDFNVGNIHAGRGYTGQTALREDHDANGQPYTTAFRAYPNQQAGADDYGNLLQRRYPGVVGTGRDAGAFGRALQAGGYMEDRDGAAKIAATASSVAQQYPNLVAGNASGMVNDAKALNDELEKTVENTRAIKAEKLDATLADIHTQMQKLEVSGQQDTPNYRGLVEREQQTIAESRNNVGPQEEAHRQSESALRAGQGYTPADQAYNERMESSRRLAAQTGDPVNAGQVSADFYAKADQELERFGAEQARATAASDLLAKAYAQGGAAVFKATAQQEAYQRLLAVLPRDAANFTTELKGLAEGYEKAARAAADLTAAQQVAADKRDVAATQEQSRLLKSGAGPDQQTVDFAGYQAGVANQNASPAAQAAAVDAARQKAQATLTFTNEKANISELESFASSSFDRIGSDITQAFTQGGDAAKTFGNLGRAVISELSQELIKLAVINPLKNAIFGNNSSLPTLNGVFGSLFGGSGQSAGETAFVAAAGHHAGGIVGAEPTFTRFMSSAMFYGAPRYHTGGVAGDEVPAVLQAGEGVFTAGQMKALGGAANGNQQGTGDTHLHLNIDARGAGPREIDTLRGQIPALAMAAVQNAAARGGKFPRTIRGV